jgi:hypothetical protein
MLRLRVALLACGVLWVLGCGDDDERPAADAGADGSDSETPHDCIAGREGCPCGAHDVCDVGLSCSGDARCVSVQGGLDQPCFANRTCNTGLTCEEGTCVACERGAKGCACLANGTCLDDTAICKAEVCVERTAQSPQPPSNPVCYSPCRSSIEDGDGFRACSAEGLMAGCLDGRECVEGSCVLPGDKPPSCESDVGCPSHQLCIAGQCYSNCEIDSDCGASSRCHRHACRPTCSAKESACGQGTFCELSDSEHGFCMPLAEPLAGSTSMRVDGTFELSADAVALSNVRSSATIKLTNNSPRTLGFKLRRVEHTVYAASGTTRTTEKPLPWLKAGLHDAPKKEDTVDLGRVPGNGGVIEIALVTEASDVPSRWDGVLEIDSEGLGTRRVKLTYAATPDGRWSGKVYYFGQFGDRNLDAWMGGARTQPELDAVGNAFVQKLGGFRFDRMTVEEFDAVLRATTTESWTWPTTRALCPGETCYLYAPSDAGPSDQGWRRYTDNNDASPIPTGIVELPIALDLKMNGSGSMTGRIASDQSLHYAADPAVSLSFAGDPSSCSGTNQPADACAVYLQSFDAQIVVGGRYRTTSADTNCSAVSGEGMSLRATPWIVPGFTADTEVDSQTGLRYTYECREDRQPFDSRDRNASLASANPIPDGKRRVRSIELVEGALINQDSLYILFRERFAEQFLGGVSDEFYAYGFMRLQRAAATLEDSAFQGSTVEPDARTTTVNVANPLACDSGLVETIIGSSTPASPSDWNQLVAGLLSGVPPAMNASTYDADASTAVHVLCHANGLFDTGQADLSSPVKCPADSGVTYFAAPVASIAANLSSLDCQRNGSCQSVLDGWIDNPPAGFQLNPVWRCDDPNEVFCSEDRTDLRADKVFFKPGVGAPQLLPLRAEMEEAFRYRTQFRNRQGDGLGFVPSVCVPNSNIVPYCYEPARIEAVRDRVDCLVSTYNAHYADLQPQTRDAAKGFLDFSFGYEALNDPTLPRPVRNDGFELLFGELLVMLGDESYTQAFQSRFDLAGAGQVSFEGSRFEPDGIDLAGVAGYEMYTLYQAAQYYQMVLERFYALSPAMWEGIALGSSAHNFVTLETVVAYLSKVLRASTQKSRAWSEIGKRYQAMNRPQLARFALERAYTSAYLESLILTRTMQRVIDVVSPSERPQIAFEIDKGQRTYKIALLDMREVYSTFTDNVTYFGFEPDYIPMPALEPNGPNAFQTLISAAQQAAMVAATKEDLAIASDRSFETDTAAFQSELAKIRSTYENQLADICGTFKADNGQLYPAIRKYAYLSASLAPLGDPCGTVGNGSLFRAMANLELDKLDLVGVRRAGEDILQKVEIERERVNKQCELTLETSDFVYHQQDQIDDMAAAILASQALSAMADRTYNILATTASLGNCSVGTATSCPQAAAALATFLSAAGGAVSLAASSDVTIGLLQDGINDIERNTAKWVSDGECDVMRTDSNARMKELLLGLKQVDLNTLRTEYQIRLALSEITRLRDQATRLMAEQEDTEQLSINIQAAKNDPNVRIYKNDAIINADRTFFRALQEAYRATKVYEYYTSQSYPRLDELTLVRLVARGDFNLENYLADLADAFYGFEEHYGRPDARVDVLSLRDDILAIPTYDEKGNALTQAQRVELFRAALADPERIDSRGYIVIPFATSLARLSPLTRNHKISYLETEIIGSDVGDAVARVYVGQSGTGTVSAVEGERLYFRFPERTAVLDPFFDGVRTFDASVYRNDRMRDRPYANTTWELIFNQRDEQANQDIHLDSLTDVRLYVYYTDFTSF